MVKADASQAYVYAGHHHTRRHGCHYISLDNEMRLRITISPLDLYDPKPPTGVPSFVKPVPWDEMNEFIKRTRPWEPHNGLVPVAYSTSDREGRWDGAWELHTHLEYMVEAFLGDKTPRPYMNSRAITSLHRPHCKWVVEGWTRPGGEELPHMNAFIIDPDPMFPDRLTTAEACTAFGLLSHSRVRDGYNSHRYIPVTIFSGSGRQMRILQCWHDKENPMNLQVRRSPIMDFQQGMEANWKDWIMILCWITGEAVGDTMNGSETVL